MQTIAITHGVMVRLCSSTPRYATKRKTCLRENLYVILNNEATKKSSADEQINQMWYVHTMEYYSVLNSEVLIHATT
jgi:hypothetical protein